MCWSKCAGHDAVEPHRRGRQRRRDHQRRSWSRDADGAGDAAPAGHAAAAARRAGEAAAGAPDHQAGAAAAGAQHRAARARQRAGCGDRAHRGAEQDVRGGSAPGGGADRRVLRSLSRGRARRDPDLAAARARSGSACDGDRRRDPGLPAQPGRSRARRSTSTAWPTSWSASPSRPLRRSSGCAGPAPRPRSPSSSPATDFRQVAASFSDAPDALQGGEMGWRPAGRLPAHVPRRFARAEGRRGLADRAQPRRLPHPQAHRRARQQRGRHRHADPRAAYPGPSQRGRFGGGCAQPADRAQVPDRQRRRLRRAGSPALGRRLGCARRRPRLGVARRHGARVRESDGCAQAQAGQCAVPQPVRLAHRSGAGAARAGHVPGPPATDRAPGDPVAQVGRAMGRLGAAAARQGLHRVSPRSSASTCMRRTASRRCVCGHELASRSDR